MSIRDTDEDWAVVAQTNPFWGVLSVDAFRGESLEPEARAAFFASGEQQIGALMGFIKLHLASDFTPARVLDFGCGVGRLLLPLARLASEAVGVDVAPRMIALCRENLRDAGLFNATVVPGDDELSRVTGKFDLVNSLIVLQHIPPDRGYRLLARLLSLLNVDGVASIQLTFAKERRFLIHEAARARYFRREGDTLRDLTPASEEAPSGTITMYDYDLNQVMLLIAEVSGHPVMALPSNDDGHIGYHFVFRRGR